MHISLVLMLSGIGDKAICQYTGIIIGWHNNGSTLVEIIMNFHLLKEINTL